MKNERGNYNAILKDFGTLGNGLAGVLDDGVGVVLDGASEVVLVADLDGFVDRRSQPRHVCLLESAFSNWERETEIVRATNLGFKNLGPTTREVLDAHNKSYYYLSLSLSAICSVSGFTRGWMN